MAFKNQITGLIPVQLKEVFKDFCSHLMSQILKTVGAEWTLSIASASVTWYRIKLDKKTV